ncbi:MAG: S8 family serine peptidase, partial [Clostridiales bacterium]|nr:S8 family serine peptidase [Clostridiales bacterium]
NMSFGGGMYEPYNDPLWYGVKYAIDNGVIVCASSGNDGSYYIDYPAAYIGVYAVGSVGYDFRRSSFSNLGDVWGYGENIESVGGRKSGTSMSSPEACVYLLFTDVLSLEYGILGEKTDKEFKVIYKNGLDEWLQADIIDGKFTTITKTIKEIKAWRDEDNNGVVSVGDLLGDGELVGNTYIFEVSRVAK